MFHTRALFYMDLFYKGRCSIRINFVGICSIRDLVRPYSMGVYSIGAVFHKDLFYKDLSYRPYSSRIHSTEIYCAGDLLHMGTVL